MDVSEKEFNILTAEVQEAEVAPAERDICRDVLTAHFACTNGDTPEARLKKISIANWKSARLHVRTHITTLELAAEVRALKGGAKRTRLGQVCADIAPIAKPLAAVICVLGFSPHLPLILEFVKAWKR